MDKTQILPPLVRGRVTGVLDFYIDEIKLYRNIPFMAESFDLMLQVQWWGESLPAFIRPEKLQVRGRVYENFSTIKSYFHYVKYEIKTTLDLFKSYTNACEVLELCVLETVENNVIGSAFLKNLNSVIINNNNKLITLPVVDYSGEEIGEIIIHFNFTYFSPNYKNNNKNKTHEICKNNSIDYKQKKKDFKKISSSYLSLAEKTLFYNKPLQENLCEEMNSPTLIGDKKNELKNSDLSSSNSEKCKCLKKKNICVSDSESKESCLPKIKTVDDSSKLLCFNLGSKEYRCRTNFKNTKLKTKNKFNTDSIKCKSKVESPDHIISSKKSPGEVQTEPICSKFQLRDLQSVPSKESSHVKVFDYLLGSDMSKDDEETALSDFKNLSPSHNLVDSISQLYLQPSERSQKCNNKSLVSPKSNHLNFDFNNPIERNYYEKFFLKSNYCNDFEIAELLNKPENTFALDRLNESHDNCVKTNTDTQTQIKEEEYVLTNKTNNCARCKYYKKLDELDTIIESLKHFEQRIIKHEKDIHPDLTKNLCILSKRNQLLKDS